MGVTGTQERRCWRHLIIAAAASALVLIAVPGPTASAQSDEPPPEIYDEWHAARIAELDELLGGTPCPAIAGHTADEPTIVTTTQRAGYLSPDESIPLLVVVDRPTYRCTYTPDGTGFSSWFSIEFVRDGESSNFQCTVERSESSTVSIGNLDPGYAIAGSYQAANNLDDPDVLENAARQVAALFVPLARPCPAEPVAVVCPDIDGYVTPEEPSTTTNSSAPDTYAAGCYYQPEGEPTADAITLETRVQWVPPRATSGARLESLCATENTFDRGWGTISGDGLAIRATYGIGSVHPIDTEPIESATRALIAQVAGQSQSCDGVDFVPHSEQYTAIPGPYASAFEPDRIAGGSPEAAPADADDTTTDAVPAPSTDDSSTPATADPDSGEPSVATDGDAVAATTEPAAPSDGSLTARFALVLRIATIVLLIVSVLGLIMSFLLIRRETRIRPWIDTVRLVIILGFAIAMMVVFSAGAPLWAVGVAVAAGLGLGYLQGQSLAIRVTESGLMGRRTAWAIAAFAASIIMSQLAGLLNRTGVIAIGIGMSFLSASLTGGLLVGRRKPIADARKALAGAGIVILIALPLATLGPGANEAGAQDDLPPLDLGSVHPDNRTPEMDVLIDAVPWDEVELTGGLWWRNGKPWTSAPVPRALDGVPVAVTRTVEWTSFATSSSTEPDSYSVTETFEFGPRIDGFCCTVTYSGEGTKTGADGRVETASASGRLDDIQSVAIEGSGQVSPTSRGGQPFTEVSEWDAPLEAGEPTVCRRTVGVTRNTRMLERSEGEADLTATRTLDGNTSELFVNSIVLLGIPCDLPGLSIEAALAAAPPPPPRDDEARGGCPVLQETIGALSAGTTMEGFDSLTLTELYLTPNAPICEYGALIAPPAIGQGGRGNTRIEFAVDVARPPQGEWDLGYSRWGARDNQIFAFTPSDIPEHERCELDADGAIVEPAPGRTCRSVTLHRIEMPAPAGFRQSPEVVAAWVQIIIDWALFDGPDATFSAAFPWASYYVRCHHCLPSNAEIADFLGRMNDMYSSGHGGFGEPDDGDAEQVDEGDEGDEGDEEDESGETDPLEEPSVDEAADATESTPTDDGPTDDQSTRDAATAAILAVLATAGLAATSLAEIGLSMPQLIEAWRDGGTSAVRARVTTAQQAAATHDRDEFRGGEPARPGAPPGEDGARPGADERVRAPADDGTRITTEGGTRVTADGDGTRVTSEDGTRVTADDGTRVTADDGTRAGDGTRASSSDGTSAGDSSNTGADGDASGPRRGPPNWENVPLAGPELDVADLPTQGDAAAPLTDAEISARQATGADGQGRVRDRWGNVIATVGPDGQARNGNGSVVQVVWDDYDNRGAEGVIDENGRWIVYDQNGQPQERVRTIAPDAARTPTQVAVWQGVEIVNGEVRTADGRVIGHGTNPTNVVDLNGDPMVARGSNVNLEVAEVMDAPDRGDRLAEDLRPVGDDVPRPPADPVRALPSDVRSAWQAAGAGPNGELYGSDGRQVGTINQDGTMTTMDGRVIVGGRQQGGQWVEIKTGDGAVFDGNGRRVTVPTGGAPETSPRSTATSAEILERMGGGDDATRPPVDEGARPAGDDATRPPVDEGVRPAGDDATRPPVDEGVRPAGDDATRPTAVDGPRGAGTLGGLLDVEGAQQLYDQHRAAGMSHGEALALAAAQTQAGNAAAAANLLGGVTDPRLSAAAGALLPGGMSNIMPDAAAVNLVGTGHSALSAVSQDLGTSFETGEINTEQLDQFAQGVREREFDPFAGAAHVADLLGEESARTDGGNLAGDLAQIYETGAGVDQLNDSMTSFSDTAGSGQYGPALEGISHLSDIGGDIVFDPTATVSDFARDVQNIYEHGVGDGYWDESLARADEVIRATPVASTIYTGYNELFSSSPSELAEGASALAGEGYDAAAQAASDAADYIWSSF